MGVWDHFHENSAVDESIFARCVNLPHACYLNGKPELSLDAQHESVRWFELTQTIKDFHHQIYMREHARWYCRNVNAGVGL